MEVETITSNITDSDCVSLEIVSIGNQYISSPINDFEHKFENFTENNIVLTLDGITEDELIALDLNAAAERSDSLLLAEPDTDNQDVADVELSFLEDDKDSDYDADIDLVHPENEAVAHNMVVEGNISKKGKRELNKKLRMEGKEYLGFRRPRNQKLTPQDVKRESRKLGPPCTSLTCRKSSKRMCNEINDNTRKEIFVAFWEKLTWKQRKVYASNLVRKTTTNRRTKKEENSRRSSATLYSLNVGHKNLPVCKTMFLHGKKSGDPKVTDVRALKYEGELISYTLDFDKDFVFFPHRPKRQTTVHSRISKTFPTGKLPIPKKKYDHLQQIKTKIDKNYWSFYDNLLCK